MQVAADSGNAANPVITVPVFVPPGASVILNVSLPLPPSTVSVQLPQTLTLTLSGTDTQVRLTVKVW